MDIKKILSACDHTLLAFECTFEQIKELCDDAIKYKTATVCIPAVYVKQAKEYVGEKLKICTVIGFPSGYSTTASKCFEALDAVKNGADEVDMVINVGMVKSRQYSKILDEINSVKQNCNGKTLKVIIEACLLSDDEKIGMCEVVSASDADFIKTSTGFSKGGATFDDIKLMKKYISNGKKIKAAGGISSLEDAEKFLELGADRLGTSRVVKIVKQNEDKYDF